MKFKDITRKLFKDRRPRARAIAQNAIDKFNLYRDRRIKNNRRHDTHGTRRQQAIAHKALAKLGRKSHTTGRLRSRFNALFMYGKLSDTQKTKTVHETQSPSKRPSINQYIVDEEGIPLYLPPPSPTKQTSVKQSPAKQSAVSLENQVSTQRKATIKRKMRKIILEAARKQKSKLANQTVKSNTISSSKSAEQKSSKHVFTTETNQNT